MYDKKFFVAVALGASLLVGSVTAHAETRRQAEHRLHVEHEQAARHRILELRARRRFLHRREGSRAHWDRNRMRHDHHSDEHF